jgi:GLPGLI family protein
MKKHLQLLVLFLGLSIVSFAQMKKGKITYDMSFSSDNPEMAMGMSMMSGSKMSLSFIPGKSRSEVSMGMMGTMTTISDESSKKILSLTNMMGMKFATESTLDEAEAAAGDQQKPKIEVTSETKDIMGYKCTKAIMTTDADGESQTVTMWFTKDIKAFTGGQQYYNEDMPGFPMEISVARDGMNIDMTVTAIEKKVSKKVFDMTVPEGYEVKTQEELMQMMGGGGE